MLRPVVALLAFGFVVADPPPSHLPSELPKGVPPLVGTAIAKDGEADTWQIELTVPKVRWELVGKIVPKSEWPRLESAVEKVTKTLTFGGPSALRESSVLDVKGAAVPAAEVRKRLKSETAVLVSVGMDQPDPFYLQLARADALVLVLGPRDNAPCAGLLPAPKGSPEPQLEGGPGVRPRK